METFPLLIEAGVDIMNPFQVNCKGMDTKKFKKEFEKTEKNSLNKEMKQTPVEVTTKTEVSVDGVTRSIDVDRSSYYNLEGKKYEVAVDKTGYSIRNSDGKNLGVLRKASNDSKT